MRNLLRWAETDRAALSSAVTVASERYGRRPSATQTVGTLGSNPATMRRCVQSSEPRSALQARYMAARKGYFAPASPSSTVNITNTPCCAKTGLEQVRQVLKSQVLLMLLAIPLLVSAENDACASVSTFILAFSTSALSISHQDIPAKHSAFECSEVSSDILQIFPFNMNQGVSVTRPLTNCSRINDQDARVYLK